jgi:hypothetical protein
LPSDRVESQLTAGLSGEPPSAVVLLAAAAPETQHVTLPSEERLERAPVGREVRRSGTVPAASLWTTAGCG